MGDLRVRIEEVGAEASADFTVAISQKEREEEDPCWNLRREREEKREGRHEIYVVHNMAARGFGRMCMHCRHTLFTLFIEVDRGKKVTRGRMEGTTESAGATSSADRHRGRRRSREALTKQYRRIDFGVGNSALEGRRFVGTLARQQDSTPGRASKASVNPGYPHFGEGQGRYDE
jgi:hypothetical protein